MTDRALAIRQLWPTELWLLEGYGQQSAFTDRTMADKSGLWPTESYSQHRAMADIELWLTESYGRQRAMVDRELWPTESYGLQRTMAN